jgi:two-component system, NtrC family, response regulator AtoC
MIDCLLIIEDDVSFGQELQRYFRGKGWEVEWAQTLSEAKKIVFEQLSDPLVITADMSLPDGNVLDLLEETRSARIPGEWILLTGYGGVRDSVRALRLGAYDFLEKPCPIARLEIVVGSARRSALAQRRLHSQARVHRQRYTPDQYVGSSKVTQQTRAMIARLAEIPFSALIIGGETGTGKGLVARILHNSGPRSEGPMIEVNCAALPRDLLESQLFGHEAGAFTGAKGRHRGYLEQAHEGTLFLDEIAEMDADLQTKLLTVIEDRRLRRLGSEKEIKVDVQIIVASNRNLAQQVCNGDFRSDLYHRLSVFKLELPPLRERLDDIRDLVPILVDEYNARAGRTVSDIPEDVYARLRDYDWPGNVRELRNVVERAVLLSRDSVFPAEWLQLGHGLRPESEGPSLEGDRLIIPLDGSMALDEMDSYIIRAALERNGYNVTATARALGTTRETLRYRIQKYGLMSSGEKPGDVSSNQGITGHGSDTRDSSLSESDAGMSRSLLTGH